MINDISHLHSAKSKGKTQTPATPLHGPEADAFFDDQVKLSPAAANPRSDSAKLQKLAAKFFKAYFDLNPGLATDLGIPGYDDYLPTYGEAESKQEVSLMNKTRHALKSIRRDQLSHEEQFDYDLFKNWLARTPDLTYYNGRHWHDEGEEYKNYPSLYGSNNAETIFGHVIYPGKSPEEDLQHVTSRLMQFPRLVAEGKKNLTHSAPKLWVQNEITQLPDSIEFLKTLPEVYKSTIDNSPEWKQKLDTGIKTACDALDDYKKFLSEKILPIADGEFAIGPKMLAYELKHNFFIDETPAQLESWAKRQSHITKQKMETLANQIEPGKTPDEVIKDMEHELPDPAHLLESYQFNTMRAKKFIIDHDLLTMPKQENIQVMQTPSFLVHSNPTAAYYIPKAFGETSKGTFIATIPGPDTPKDEMDEMLGNHNEYAMRNTIVHEAFPGHHVQLSLAREVKESPLRKLMNGVMQTDIKVEGWGLYSEQLMEEQGFNGSPKDQMMRLKWLLHRQVRVQIGIGLQSGKLTRDEAVKKFMASEPGLTKQVAEGEVDYFTQLPLQPLSYALGLRQLLNLRAKLQNKLGSDFSLKAYHDAVMNTGNLPLGLVEKQVEHDAIARSRKHAQEQEELAS